MSAHIIKGQRIKSMVLIRYAVIRSDKRKAGGHMFEMALGHLVGDYLLQSTWMAKGKSKYSGLGWSICTVHCILYTIAVCTMMWNWDLRWVLVVFFSHFIVDKFGIAEKYLKLIKGRSIEMFLSAKENETYTPYTSLSAGATVFVYIVVDNTMHLMIMWGGWNVLYS